MKRSASHLHCLLTGLVGLGSLVSLQDTAAAVERRVVVHLSAGTEVSGSIPEDGFDEGRGITLRRDDNGGILRLRWDQIRPADVTHIKRLYGFLGDRLPPIQIQALKVTTANGTLIGLDGGRKDGKLLLRKKDNITPIPLESIIRPPETILVDALELENPANVFELKKREQPPTQPVDWYNLGLVAESLTLFEQARTCFNTAMELDPNFSKQSVIQTKISNLAVKEKELEQTLVLRTIRSLKYRGAFREALGLVDDFVERWPTSAQLADVQKEKADIGRSQRKALLGSIRADFFSYLRRAAEDKGRDQELTLGEAMTWAKEEAYFDVQAKLMALYGATEEQIDDLWDSRGNTGSPVQYSYGGGTFILDEKAKEGYGREKKEEEVEENKKGDKPKTLEEKIQEKIKEKQEQREKKKKQQKKIGQIADVPPTDVDWYKQAAPKYRTSFLIAFFAENSGKVEVLNPRRRDCSTCSGKGVLEFFGSVDPDRADSEVACPRCKTLTFDRIAVFR